MTRFSSCDILPPPDPAFQQDNLRPEVPDEFYIKEIDVYSKLSDISYSQSPGLDKIPNWVLKGSQPLLKLFFKFLSRFMQKDHFLKGSGERK